MAWRAITLSGATETSDRHLKAMTDLIRDYAKEVAREVAESVWDEGFSRGFYVGVGPEWGIGSDASEPDVTNPYGRDGAAS